MSRKLLILAMVALMAALLAFGLSEVGFARNEPAIVVDDPEDEECAELGAEYEELVIEDNVEEKPEVAEEIESCLA